MLDEQAGCGNLTAMPTPTPPPNAATSLAATAAAGARRDAARSPQRASLCGAVQVAGPPRSLARRITVTLAVMGMAAACGEPSDGAHPAGPGTAPPPTPPPPPAVVIGAEAIDFALVERELAATDLTIQPVTALAGAKEAVAMRRWKDAAAALASWRAAHPGHPQALLALWAEAWAHGRAEAPAVAATAFEATAARAGPLRPLVWAWAAEHWLAAGDVARARAAWSNVPASGGYRPEATLTWLGPLVAEGPAAALAAWREALARVPAAGADRYDAAAKAALAAGDAAQAASWWRQVRVRHPGGKADARAQGALAAVAAPLRSLTSDEQLARLGSLRAAYEHELVIAEADAIIARADVGTAPWCEAIDARARATEIFWLRRKEAMELYQRAVAACSAWRDISALEFRAAKRFAQSASGPADRKWAIETLQRLERRDAKATIVDDAMRWRARLLREEHRDGEADAVLRTMAKMGGDMAEYAAWDLLWSAVQRKDWPGVDKLAAELNVAGIQEERDWNDGRLRYWVARAAELGRRKPAAVAGYRAVVTAASTSYYGWLALARLGALDARAAADVARHLATRPQPPIATMEAAVVRHPAAIAAWLLARMGLGREAQAAAATLPATGAAQRLTRARLLAAVGAPRQAMTAVEPSDYAQWRPEPASAAVWATAYPRPAAFAPRVAAVAKEEGVDAAFVWAIMRTESRFEPEVQSPVGATGLLQLMPATAKAVNAKRKVRPTLDAADLQDPDVNIPLGTAYLRQLFDELGGHEALVASGYNAGPGNTRKWLAARQGWPLDAFVEAIPFQENRRYVKAVLMSWRRYRALAGAPPVAPTWSLAPRKPSRR